jgi:membrane protein DedA with SNARE-associated domain/rhodanese-related sulfurtransferase
VNALLAEHGLVLVYLAVLAEQLGAPLPAWPLLVVAGALAADGHFSPWTVVAVALLGAVIGDTVWFLAGRRYGHRVLATLCRISISPDSCVRQTEDFFLRYGASTLLFAKFVPGLSTVAPPLAGAMRFTLGRFLGYAGLGLLVWAGSGVLAGLVFHREVDAVLAVLESVGTLGLVVLGTLLALFIAWKWWERQRVLRMLAMVRITPEELHRLMSEGQEPVILDVRSRAGKALDLRRIPGSIAVALETIDAEIGRLPRDREVVVYCACPNEVSAAKLAGILRRRGFRRVRPLLGGIDAWEAAGLELERS